MAFVGPKTDICYVVYYSILYQAVYTAASAKTKFFEDGVVVKLRCLICISCESALMLKNFSQKASHFMKKCEIIDAGSKLNTLF